MFFAYMCLRPVAAEQLEPPQRIRLWIGTFKRFFPFVWISVVLLPLTGYNMMFTLWGGFAHAPIYVHLMNGLGTVMILIYLHVFFAPFRRMQRFSTTDDIPAAGASLNQIRKLVGLNTIIGLIVILIAAGGRFLG
jgi:uncharacterized membrane protein